MFEEKLIEFEQTTWYDILESIVKYFCTKVNIHKYKLHNLTHLDYFFYIILRYFTENPGELKELVEKKLIGLNELETYDITMSKNDITDARELFRIPHYNNMYLLFMYMFKRFAYIINILDLQINDLTINTKLQTFTRGIISGPFINFSIAFCNYVDILAFLLFSSLFPLNLQNQLTSDLYLLYHNNEIIEQSKSDSEYRKNLFTQLQKTPNTDNQIINNKNQLFFFTTDQPKALYKEINTTKSLVNLYKIILILRLSINRPAYCEREIITEFRKCLSTKQSSLTSLYPISSLTDLFITKDSDAEDIKKEIREKQKSEKKILEDAKLIKRCLKQSERKLSETPSIPLKEILIDLNKSYQSLTIENIKNIIKTHVNLYKQKCQSNKEVISVLVNLILDKTLELDDLNNLKNLAKFSQKLVNKTCIMNEDQKNIFIQEYDKLINRKEKIVNTEEELNDIFQRMGIQDEYTSLDIYSMY